MKKAGKIVLIIIGFLLVITLLLKLCNGRSSGEEAFTAKVKPDNVSVLGDLSDYLQIVDNEYEVTKDMMYNITVKAKAIKPYDKSLKNKEINLSLTLMGENGSPISEIHQFTLYGGEDNIQRLLAKGSGEEIVRFTAVATFQQVDPKKIKKFSISSNVKDEKPSSQSQTNDHASASGASSGPAEYDELLDSYEKLADDYIKIIDNMNNDEVGGAIVNYADALKNTLEVQKKLDAAKSKGNMSTDQINRLINIEAKMATAMTKSMPKHKQ